MPARKVGDEVQYCFGGMILTGRIITVCRFSHGRLSGYEVENGALPAPLFLAPHQVKSKEVRS